MTFLWALFTGIMTAFASFATFNDRRGFAAIMFGFAVYAFCGFLRALVEEAKR